MELNLRQGDIARILRCDTTPVHNWETGRTKPMLSLIPKIIRFLGYIPDLFPIPTLGQKIVACRTIRGLSQKELALELEIDPAILRRYEYDQGQLKASVNIQLIHHLKACLKH